MPIRLNTGFRADLAWWQSFVSRWNGISFLPTFQQLLVHRVTSDASGHWGCGAWSGESWFQVPWDANTTDLPITVKELLPILLVGVLWGRELNNSNNTCW